jgi:hypothetical protein
MTAKQLQAAVLFFLPFSVALDVLIIWLILRAFGVA